MFTPKTYSQEPWLSFAEAVELSGSVLLGVYQAQIHTDSCVPPTSEHTNFLEGSIVTCLTKPKSCP